MQLEPPSIRRHARVFGVASALVSLASAVTLGYAISWLSTDRVTLGLVVIAAVLVVRWLLATTTATWGQHAAASIKDYWRRALPTHVRLPRHESRRSRGDLATAIDHAADVAYLDLVETSARVAMVGLIAVLWAGGWLSTLITIALLAAAVPLYQRAGRRSEAMSVEYDARRAVLEARQLELLQHSTELRALGAVSFGADEIAAISDSEHSVALRAIRVALESSLITEFLSGVSIGLVAMVVGFALLGGRIALSHALVAVLVTSEIFVNVRRFGTEFHRREDALRAAALLASRTSYDAPTTSDALLSCDGLVTSASATPVSIRLSPGERILITGPSGAGKTTLLETLVGWRAAKTGSLQRTDEPIAFVSVESALLSGTIRENLLLDRDVDDATLRATLHALGLDGPRFSDLDLALLPDGRGLSSGERVRLVLARAILARPAVLVLDDIAGVLDQPSRARVRAVIDRDDNLGVIEATVDTPVASDFDQHVVVA